MDVLFSGQSKILLSPTILSLENTVLKNSIIHTGAIIEDGAHLENCIVGSRAYVKSDVRLVAAESDNPAEIHVLNS